MMVSGFSFVRNGVRFDYPFLESIASALPLVDEFVIVVGKSDDDTLARIRNIRSPKIHIIESVWDEGLRTGGLILSQQTNLALEQIRGDWGLYLQADEVLHEDDYPAIRRAIAGAQDDVRVEGLLFKYVHFFGSYRYVGHGRRWYRREIRIVRNRVGARSWGDAQGFRIGERKMRVRLIPARVFHYGWVKSPAVQQAKQQVFNRYWHPDYWLSRNVGSASEYDYSRGGRVKVFEGTHPAVMQSRVEQQSTDLPYDLRKNKGRLKDRVLDWVEDATGYRVGEYRNYEILPDRPSD